MLDGDDLPEGELSSRGGVTQLGLHATVAEGANERLRLSRVLLGRGWSLLLLGAVLAGLAVAFFVTTSMRDGALLRSGEQTSAVVVRSVPAGSWNLFDCGRLVVKYQTARGPHVQQIWLDDTAHLQDPGTRVTVVFDPGEPSRVRTLHDANDPVPWGQPILIAGLLGAVAFIVGLRDVIRSTCDRRDARRPADGAPEAFPVRMTSLDVPRTGRDVPAGIPFVPASGEPAWSHPRTQRAWRQYLKRVLVLGAIAVALMTIAVIANQVVGSGDADLMAHGDRTTGVVIDGGGYGGKSSQDWVRVLYIVDGAAQLGDLHGPSPDELSTGAEVEVYYDAAEPGRFRTATYANHSNVVDTFGLAWPDVGAAFIGSSHSSARPGFFGGVGSPRRPGRHGTAHPADSSRHGGCARAGSSSPDKVRAAPRAQSCSGLPWGSRSARPVPGAPRGRKCCTCPDLAAAA